MVWAPGHEQVALDANFQAGKIKTGTKFTFLEFLLTKGRRILITLDRSGGVSLLSSHPPEGQTIRVRIPPGCKESRNIITMLS
jgi:hypothetical protein